MSIDDTTTEALDFLGKLPRHHGEETIATAAPPAMLARAAARRCATGGRRRGRPGRALGHVREAVPRAAGLRPPARAPSPR